MLNQNMKIAGERIVVIPEGRLARAAEASTVVGDDSIAIEK